MVRDGEVDLGDPETFIDYYEEWAINLEHPNLEFTGLETSVIYRGRRPYPKRIEDLVYCSNRWLDPT